MSYKCVCGKGQSCQHNHIYVYQFHNKLLITNFSYQTTNKLQYIESIELCKITETSDRLTFKTSPLRIYLNMSLFWFLRHSYNQEKLQNILNLSETYNFMHLPVGLTYLLKLLFKRPPILIVIHHGTARAARWTWSHLQ